MAIKPLFINNNNQLRKLYPAVCELVLLQQFLCRSFDHFVSFFSSLEGTGGERIV
jgi:hypothetical protein